MHTIVLTAERVPLALPLAGLGERAIAASIDFIIVLLLGVAVLFAYTFFGRGDLQRDVSGATTVAVLIAVATVLSGIVLYDVVGDRFFAGRTPGKRLQQLRVIDQHGRPPDLVTSLLRNVLRLIDMIPIGYGVGLVVMFFTGTRRVGDLVAGTVVISERGRGTHIVTLLREAAGDLALEAVALSDDDVSRIIDTVKRTAGLEGTLSARSCERLLQSLGERAGTPGSSPLTTTTTTTTTTTNPARARLAAAVLASATTDRGLASRLLRLFDAEQTLALALADFDAARNSRRDRRRTNGASVAMALDAAGRQASSELLAATRRGVPPRLLESVSLALLDVERRRRTPALPLWPRLTHFLAVAVPTAVWSERAGVVRAALVLGGAGALGFTLAFLDPSLSRALIGDGLVELVEQGANWTNQIERDGQYLQASLQIIFNNVGVGLRVFAVGILGGVATVLALISNGLSLGATFGTAYRLDTHETLARFIFAHGPVELSMVCVAGAAGFCLGRAVLAPGSRSRLQALREEGRRGFLLVTFATIGFLFIGTVEGFISPGAHFPAVANAAVGVGLWLLFFGWARLGRSAR